MCILFIGEMKDDCMILLGAFYLEEFTSSSSDSREVSIVDGLFFYPVGCILPRRTRRRSGALSVPTKDQVPGVDDHLGARTAFVLTWAASFVLTDLL